MWISASSKEISRGDLKLRWEVTYAQKYGQPGPLAYKLDTLVIKRTVDQAGRPLPPFLCLGSLREIARELDLGGNTARVKKALRQNAGAFITAKLTYKTVDKGEKMLEADFNRYGVIFTGEKLPDGRRADAVYVVFNEPYREVVNNAPMRPLDYDYLKQLPPGPQRFYEIVSYRMFAAIRFRHSEAKLPYSEYCAFSAQQRYYEYESFRKQMYKIHREHLKQATLGRFATRRPRTRKGSRIGLCTTSRGRRPTPSIGASPATSSGCRFGAETRSDIGNNESSAAPASQLAAAAAALAFDQDNVIEITPASESQSALIGELTKQGDLPNALRESFSRPQPYRHRKLSSINLNGVTNRSGTGTPVSGIRQASTST